MVNESVEVFLGCLFRISWFCVVRARLRSSVNINSPSLRHLFASTTSSAPLKLPFETFLGAVKGRSIVLELLIPKRASGSVIQVGRQ